MADAIHRNYVITPSVDGSGNMTIAIKTLAGTDPSVSDPVLFKIGDTWRAVTAALSVTISAGANTFNAGSSELATNAVGLFCYVGYNSTDGVTFGPARIPWAEKYSDFSATATNEQYCKISDITSASASDVYTVIGYMEATLSAGAGYTWSAPGSVMNYPVYETKWLTWVPTWAGAGSLTYTSVTNTISKYKISLHRVEVVCRATGTLGGTANVELNETLPFDCADAANDPALGGSLISDTANPLVFGGAYVSAGTPDVLKYVKYDASINFSNSGTGVVVATGTYRA